MDTKTEEEEAPQMIDGKPVVFASSDVREKKKNTNEEEKRSSISIISNHFSNKFLIIQVSIFCKCSVL